MWSKSDESLRTIIAKHYDGHFHPGSFTEISGCYMPSFPARLGLAHQHVDLVAKHGVLEHQLASGPDRVRDDAGDLACLSTPQK